MKSIIEPLHWELGNRLELKGNATKEELQKGKKFGEKLVQEVLKKE